MEYFFLTTIKKENILVEEVLTGTNLIPACLFC